jgi:hypothetical protein
VAKSAYLGMTVTDKNYNHREVKNRFNSGNVCYHSVQKTLSSHLFEMQKLKKLKYAK